MDAGHVVKDEGWLDNPGALIRIDTECAKHRMLGSLGARIERSACSFYISFQAINITRQRGRPNGLVRERAALAWIDQFWDYQLSLVVTTP